MRTGRWSEVKFATHWRLNRLRRGGLVKFGSVRGELMVKKGVNF